jgi:hypothetical protein
MLTKITKFVAVGILLFAGMRWHYVANDQLLFGSIVCAGSIFALYHALRAQKRLLACEFLGVALLFNPVVPLLAPAGNLSLLAVWISTALIATSLITFRALPILSTPSITDRNPESASLEIWRLKSGVKS